MLTVVLLDVRWLEIIWVLDVVENTAEGWEAIEIVCEMRSASCIDDIPSIHYGIGYFFSVIVVVRLRPRGLACWWSATPGAMMACDFLILLVSLILLLQLLLTMMASRGTTCLSYDCCGSP